MTYIPTELEIQKYRAVLRNQGTWLSASQAKQLLIQEGQASQNDAIASTPETSGGILKHISTCK